ncbi:DUF3348 domain-containing protein [Paraburkholderia susongensis]|uniref:DUF3348 domain-containing protein n=1 Tax=Paraburkholderia susongensis TaxID=1515439 RepID=A0A1X7LC39_9BURK|nr:DUF3348 domain-containing protein [Paraburkholderia susongensis]SMG51064.1 Protein of unknown function [Paraburkholderia susongensis]
MLQAPQRTALSGPALVRLLARLADVDAVESKQSLSDRLSQWLGWTDAIALSSALNGSPPAAAAGARSFGRAEEDECARVRNSLASAIAGDSVFAVARRRGSAQAAPRGSVETQADYAVFRQRYLALQQSMETAIGTLRGRLRALLAARTPAFARLAVVDAVMERALSERERTLLAAVPGLLGGHFERLRDAAAQQSLAEAEVHAATEAEAEAAATSTDPSRPAATTAHAAPLTQDTWLNVFRKDMQSVLLAELDVRFQPVEGLLAALRAC